MKQQPSLLVTLKGKNLKLTPLDPIEAATCYGGRDLTKPEILLRALCVVLSGWFIYRIYNCFLPNQQAAAPSAPSHELLQETNFVRGPGLAEMKHYEGCTSLYATKEKGFVDGIEKIKKTFYIKETAQDAEREAFSYIKEVGGKKYAQDAYTVKQKAPGVLSKTKITQNLSPHEFVSLFMKAHEVRVNGRLVSEFVVIPLFKSYKKGIQYYPATKNTNLISFQALEHCLKQYGHQHCAKEIFGVSMPFKEFAQSLISAYYTFANAIYKGLNQELKVAHGGLNAKNILFDPRRRSFFADQLHSAQHANGAKTGSDQADLIKIFTDLLSSLEADPMENRAIAGFTIPSVKYVSRYKDLDAADDIFPVLPTQERKELLNEILKEKGVIFEREVHTIVIRLPFEEAQPPAGAYPPNAKHYEESRLLCSITESSLFKTSTKKTFFVRETSQGPWRKAFFYKKEKGKQYEQGDYIISEKAPGITSLTNKTKLLSPNEFAKLFIKTQQIEVNGRPLTDFVSMPLFKNANQCIQYYPTSKNGKNITLNGLLTILSSQGYEHCAEELYENRSMPYKEFAKSLLLAYDTFKKAILEGVNKDLKIAHKVFYSNDIQFSFERKSFYTTGLHLAQPISTNTDDYALRRTFEKLLFFLHKPIKVSKQLLPKLNEINFSSEEREKVLAEVCEELGTEFKQSYNKLLDELKRPNMNTARSFFLTQEPSL